MLHTQNAATLNVAANFRQVTLHLFNSAKTHVSMFCLSKLVINHDFVNFDHAISHVDEMLLQTTVILYKDRCGGKKLFLGLPTSVNT